MPANQKAAFTINEFCRRQGISRSTYYKLRRADQGPREMKVGGVVRISRLAERDWIADAEAGAAAGSDDGSSSSDSGSGAGDAFQRSGRRHRSW
jgi:predicted DNA-binding transcriptional regulator AlpA